MSYSFLTVALTALAASLLLLALYLLVLTVAAVLASNTAPTGRGRRRFAVLVPAHNEEALIGRLLEAVCATHYPAELVDTYVVADNCTDATAAVARQHGARVYERQDAHHQGKGHALEWLLDHVRRSGAPYDAFVIFDADSVMSANFFSSMDARLERGSQAVQAYYSVLNTTESPVAALRFAALAAVHYLRPLGRAALGLSCGLKGNGMCFAATLIDRFDWHWYTLAEDVEFHLVLVAQGVRVDFAPEAVVLADMPVTLTQAASQNQRWERGRLQLLRYHAPGLLRDGLRLASPLRLDAVAEQCIPPLSVPVALGLALLIASVAGQAYPAAILATLGLSLQLAYVLAALTLVHAPWSAYLALAHAPTYVAWKVGLYAQALVSTRTMAWVRTARHQPTSSSHSESPVAGL
jgi:cellulose synthase/poly-beta-1,6-N-acetylglucosamine synthase-like glycosyltransferase